MDDSGKAIAESAGFLRRAMPGRRMAVRWTSTRVTREWCGP